MGQIRPISRRDSDSTLRTGTPALGHILLERDWIAAPALEQALEAQTVTGVRLGQVIAANGWTSRERIGRALAEQWGLGFVDLAADPPDHRLVAGIEPELCLETRVLPWRSLGFLTTYVTDRPEAAAAALDRVGAGGMAMIAVATSEQMDRALSAAFADQMADRAATLLPAEQSVRRMRGARWLVGVGLLAAIGLLVFGGGAALTAGFAVVLLVHLATLVLRGAALIAGALPVRDAASAAPDTVRLADHRKRPIVSLLVPLFREGEMVGRIAAALSALDYPRELLDVKLLVEEADHETRAAVARADLPSWIGVLLVPEGQPRTKPRALNHALTFCRGDVIGVLDAEDRPDPQQIARVVDHLADAPPETMAVQCQLGYYNAAENWLSRCFQLEYSIWFEVLLRGYDRLGLPLPLGGTSVYFRASALRALGGWDAHNVTEDADLGVRLVRAGGHCAVLRSTTDEEAACSVIRWIRQRSRWTKGYLMTWLAHMRRPAALWRDLGPKGFMAFQVIFLGGAMTYLGMPLFWASLAMWLGMGDGLWSRAVPEVLTAPVGASLVVGWGIMLAAATIAMARRRSLGLLLWAPSLPFYWWLGAVAAWKALIELILAPYYWDKTRHGVSRLAGEEALAEPVRRKPAEM